MKKRHELSAMFPDMGSDEFGDLVASIELHGYLGEEIMLLDDMIIDGWHRYMAALEAGMIEKEIPMKEFDQKIDPLDYVITINSNRRHLTTSQRAMIAASMVTTQNGGNKKQSANLQSVTVGHAANIMKVSPRSVSMAKKIMSHGAADDIVAAKTGDKSLNELVHEIKASGLFNKKPRKPPVRKPRYEPMPEMLDDHMKADDMTEEDLDIQIAVYEDEDREWLLEKIKTKDLNLQRAYANIMTLKMYIEDLQSTLDAKLEHKSKREFDELLDQLFSAEDEAKHAWAELKQAIEQRDSATDVLEKAGVDYSYDPLTGKVSSK